MARPLQVKDNHTFQVNSYCRSPWHYIYAVLVSPEQGSYSTAVWIFSMSFPWVFHDKIDFFHDKIQAYTGHKIVEECITSPDHTDSIKMCITTFFLLTNIFSMSFPWVLAFLSNSMSSQSWKIKLKFSRFSMTRRNPAQLSRHCHYCAESERKAIFTHPLQTQTIYPSKHSTLGQRCINVTHMFCVWEVWYHRYKPDQYP